MNKHLKGLLLKGCNRRNQSNKFLLDWPFCCLGKSSPNITNDLYANCVEEIPKLKERGAMLLRTKKRVINRGIQRKYFSDLLSFSS